MAANLTRVIRAICAHPWAIMPEKLDAICSIAEFRANGGRLSKDEIRAALGGQAARSVRVESGGSVAVIPIHGVISHRMNMLTDFSGGTSLEVFRNQFRKAVADPDITAIVLDIDSPGGSTYMVEEAAAEIFAVRKQKRIVAQVNCLMASAALWLGSQAEEIVMSPSGDAGSLGVYMVHDDYSKALEERGIKVTYITSDISPYKVEGNPDQPLTDEAFEHLKGEVNAVADKFIKAVAKGRGLKVSHVRQQFGQGRTLLAPAALEAKMVDRLGTLEDTVVRVARETVGRQGRSSEVGSRDRLIAVVSDPAKVVADWHVAADMRQVPGEAEGDVVLEATGVVRVSATLVPAQSTEAVPPASTSGPTSDSEAFDLDQLELEAVAQEMELAK